MTGLESPKSLYRLGILLKQNGTSPLKRDKRGGETSASPPTTLGRESPSSRGIRIPILRGKALVLLVLVEGGIYTDGISPI